MPQTTAAYRKADGKHNGNANGKQKRRESRRQLRHTGKRIRKTHTFMYATVVCGIKEKKGKEQIRAKKARKIKKAAIANCKSGYF